MNDKHLNSDLNYSAIYIDGGLHACINQILSGKQLLPLDIHNLASYAEAFVLYDYILISFNYASPAHPQQNQIERKAGELGIVKKLKEDVVDSYRTTRNCGGGLFPLSVHYYPYLAESCSCLRLDELKTPTSRYRAITKLRENLFNLHEQSEVGLVRAALRDIKDEVNISDSLGMDLLTLTECSPLIYPRTDSMFLSLKLYKELADVHRIKVERLLDIMNPRPLYIPPILSLLLDRSKSRDDMLDVLIELRDEFQPYRQAMRDLSFRLNESVRLSEQLNATEEYYSTVDSLAKRIEKPQIRVLQLVWDVVKEGSLSKMLVTALDKLRKDDLEKTRLRRISGFFDLWSSSLNVKNYSSLIERMLGPTSKSDTTGLDHAVKILHNICA